MPRYMFKELGYLPCVAACLLSAVLGGCSTAGYRMLDVEVLKAQSATRADLGPLKSPMTMPAAIERALACGGDVAVLKKAVDVAIMRKKAAGDFTDPELRMTYRDGTRDTDSRDWQTFGTLPYEVLTNSVETSRGFSAGLRFFPPNPWTRSARMSAETANINAACMDLKAAEWLVAIQVSRLFTDIRYLEKDAAILDDLVALYDENIKLFKQRAAQGQSSLPDVMTVSQRYLQTLSRRDRVLRDFFLAKRRLAALTGVPVNDLKIVESQGDVLKAADAKKLTLDQLEQKALVSRADLSALNWRCLAAEATYREAAAERIPWFNFLQGSYAVSSQDEKGGIGSGLAPPGSLSDYSMADASEWRVDAAINLPLLGWLNDTPALRMAEYQQLKTQLAEKIKNIYQSFQDALDTMHSLGERQAMYDTESEPVLRDMQKVLDSLSSGTGMSPDQIMRVKEQMLELQRLKLEQDHEFRLGIVNLEETLGTWLAPIEWR